MGLDFSANAEFLRKHGKLSDIKGKVIVDGPRTRIFFKNGYGVSIIPEYFNKNNWEIAVLLGSEESFELYYNTPVTDDVLRNLTVCEVEDIIKQVANL